MNQKNNLRFGIIVANKQIDRYIVAVLDEADYPIVFNRYMTEDDFGVMDSYDVYQTFTNGEAKEILDYLEAGETAKARRTLLKIIDKKSPDLEMAGPVRLDDYIPDLWYDAWKQMEPYITSSGHMPGYLECQVSSDEYW